MPNQPARLPPAMGGPNLKEAGQQKTAADTKPTTAKEHDVRNARRTRDERSTRTDKPPRPLYPHPAL